MMIQRVDGPFLEAFSPYPLNSAHALWENDLSQFVVRGKKVAADLTGDQELSLGPGS